MVFEVTIKKESCTNLCQGSGKVIAILVHEMVCIALVFLAQLLHNFIHILFREVCGAQGNGFSS